MLKMFGVLASPEKEFMSVSTSKSDSENVLHVHVRDSNHSHHSLVPSDGGELAADDCGTSGKSSRELATSHALSISTFSVDAEHTEFTANFDAENSCEVYMPAAEGDDHGTACASIIGASANDLCAVGIAHGATLSSCTISLGDENFDESAMFLSKMDSVDISSNSWGPTIVRCILYKVKILCCGSCLSNNAR